MTPQEIEELSWRMGEVYEAVVNRILVNLARHFRYIEAGEIPSGAWEYQVKKLAEMGQINRETERIILDMLGDADGALQALLEESILNGLRDAEPALRSAAEKGFLPGGSNIPPVLAPNQMQAFKAFYAQSADKLNLVNTVMLESTQAAFAATVSDIAVRIANTQGILNAASGEVVTGVSGWNKAMRDAVNKMVDNGLTGYIDHAGRHWSPEAYVTMDIRSTMANTARAAVFERNEDYGNDLYQVSWHNGARPLCYPWQGKVISRTGNARVVEDDEGNEVQVHTEDEIESFNYGGGLFGVNCGHYPIPFIPNFSRIRQPMENAEQNAKTYEESQKQRTLERKLRNEKRDLEVLKAQGASEDVLKEQRRRVRKASKDIDEFCAETGRARRRNREYTPIDPKFPDPDTYDPKLFPNDEKSKIDNWFRNGNDTDQPMVNIHAEGDDVPPARTFTPAKSIDEAETVASNLSASEKAAVESYVSGDTMYINQVLRGRAGELTAEDKELVKDLDKALSKPIGKTQTLYRSVDAEAVFGKMSSIEYDNLRGYAVYNDSTPVIKQNAESIIAKAQGKTIHELGYMSTTTDYEVASEWGGYTGSEKPIVLKLNTPASTHGLALTEFEVVEEAQSEVLLSRGQRYQIKRVTGEDGNIVVYADVLKR